ncbi:hypothetical protein ACGFIW_01990 [Micromonospora sp. NPDC048935]
MTEMVSLPDVGTSDPLCTCTIDPDGARNTDGCVLCDLPPCGFLVGEVNQ